jgi:hypothetical protein
VAQDLFGWETLLPGDAQVITGKRRLPLSVATTTTVIEEDNGGSTTQVDAPPAASNLLIMRGLPDKGR